MVFGGGNRSIAINLHVNPAGVAAGLAVARKHMVDFARSAAEESKKERRAAQERAEAYGSVAGGFAKAGLALGAFAAVSVVSAAKFDKAMSRAAAGTQATTSQLTALRSAAIKAGADTQYSATQAADAITEMGKAGVAVRDILGGGLTGTLSLAAAGQLEVARASEIAATTMTQFGLRGEDLGHVADVLAAGAGKAQGSVEDLANGLKYVGPYAAQAGISLETTTGVLAEFASQGIIGEQAGTTFRSVLASLAAPSKIAGEKMRELGIEMYDANGNFIGMEDAAQELQDKLSGLSAAQRNAAMEVIFGREALTGATVLYKGGAAAVAEWTSKVNDQGFAAEQAAKLMDNLSGDLEKLKGSLETAFISSGSGATDGLRDIVQVVDGAVDAFNAIPAPVQHATVLIAGVGAASLLATAGVLKLAGAAAVARTNLATLGVTAATTRASLLLLGKAFAVVGTAAAAVELGEFVGKAQATRVATDDLAAAALAFAKNGKLSGDGLKAFGTGFGPFKDNATDTAEAMDKFGSAAARALDQGWDARLGRWQSMGTATAKFREQVTQWDDALASLVTRGHGAEAEKMFNALTQAAVEQGLPMATISAQFTKYQAAVGESAEATVRAAGAGASYAASMQSAENVATQLTNAQNALAAALDGAQNAFLQGRAAARDYEAAQDAAADAAKRNGETTDESTEKGRENAAALDQLATSTLAYLSTLTGPNGEATPKFNAALKESRTNLIATARAMGMSKTEAKAYADKILAIPASKITEVTLLNAQNAINQITTLRENLGRIPGSKTVYLRVERGPMPSIGAGKDVASADGNIIRFYGEGGMENHVAQIARPSNTVRVWAEPETGGEAYIPLAPSKRGRSKAILKQTAGIFGMQAFAAGGFNNPFGSNDVFQRYQGLLPKPITADQVAAAVRAATNAENARRNAATRLADAERALTAARRKGGAERIRDAEDRLDRARRSHSQARSREAAAEKKEADALRRKNAPKGFQLGVFESALRGTVSRNTAYQRNLASVSKRGGSALAGALEAMGTEGVDLVAALARAPLSQLRRVAALLRKLDPEAFGVGQKTTKFAAGGIAPATMGGWRVFAEAGQDEAFIPLGSGNRARSRALTSETASRLGGAVTWSNHRIVPGASGVSAAPSSTAGGGGGVAMNVGTVQLLRGGPEDVARDVMFAVRQLGG